MEPTAFFLTLFLSLIPVILVTGLIVKWLAIRHGWLKQLFAMFVSLTIALLFCAINTGIFSHFQLWHSISFGIVSSFMANGVYHVPAIRKMVDWLYGKVQHKG